MAITKPEKTQEAIKDIKVTKCTDIGNGQYRININVNGVDIYAARYLVGKNGAFIAFPSYKGKDGKFYNNCYCKFSDKEIEIIESGISSLL